ncbi:unnamed protein product [Symbiodinium sp. CCMP2456]|nr:unnamed protein product [Symbiodinium sp. CCMP2456]
MRAASEACSETEDARDEQEADTQGQPQHCQGLSPFFSRSRKSKLASRLKTSYTGSRIVEDEGGQAEKVDRVWLSIRPWVCLHALVAMQRAHPICNPGCEDWEEEGASERAVLAHSRKENAPTAEEFAWTAFMVVSLPPECLARALEFVHGDVSSVFAPEPRAPYATHCSSETKSAQVRNWQCCRYLLSQQSCLHGRVVQSGRSGRSLSLACWYCTATFPHGLEGVEQLKAHAEAAHASEILAYIRKTRKVKARRQRERYQAGPGGQVRRDLELQKQLGKLR